MWRSLLRHRQLVPAALVRLGRVRRHVRPRPPAPRPTGPTQRPTAAPHPRRPRPQQGPATVGGPATAHHDERGSPAGTRSSTSPRPRLPNAGSAQRVDNSHLPRSPGRRLRQPQVIQYVAPTRPQCRPVRPCSSRTARAATSPTPRAAPRPRTWWGSARPPSTSGSPPGRMPATAPLGPGPAEAAPADRRPGGPDRRLHQLAHPAAPFIPRSTLKGANLAQGASLFALNCAACHTITGVGRRPGHGTYAPTLHNATPTQVA